MRHAVLTTFAILCTACAGEPETPAAPATPAPPAAADAAAPATDTPIQTAPVPTPGAPVPQPVTTVQTGAFPIQPLPMSLTYGQVEKSLEFHRRHFHELYLSRLKAKPKLHGTMLVSFKIAPDGSAHDATLTESTLGDPVFEKEILQQVEATSFPPASGPTPVERYPFDFSPQPRPPRTSASTQ